MNKNNIVRTGCGRKGDAISWLCHLIDTRTLQQVLELECSHRAFADALSERLTEAMYYTRQYFAGEVQQKSLLNSLSRALRELRFNGLDEHPDWSRVYRALMSAHDYIDARVSARANVSKHPYSYPLE